MVPLLTSETSSISIRRLLMEGANEQSRAVLTILYMAVLFLCFIVPVFYYLRMHCEHRQARRLLELEIAALAETLQQSEDFNREETQAARRKYRGEQRARIIQLFSPVRLRLKRVNFPHLREHNETQPSIEQEGNGKSNAERESTEHREKEGIETGSGSLDIENAGIENVETDIQLRDASGKSIDFDNLFVEIPAPGLSVTPNSKNLRLVPNLCTICLCNYEIGTDIVWSSNSVCDHAFHSECIEQWLMNQREGPLCPCCRRDFILDPYDLDGDNEEIIESELEERQIYIAPSEDVELQTTEEDRATAERTETEVPQQEMGQEMDV